MLSKPSQTHNPDSKIIKLTKPTIKYAITHHTKERVKTIVLRRLAIQTSRKKRPQRNPSLPRHNHGHKPPSNRPDNHNHDNRPTRPLPLPTTTIHQPPTCPRTNTHRLRLRNNLRRIRPKHTLRQTKIMAPQRNRQINQTQKLESKHKNHRRNPPRTKRRKEKTGHILNSVPVEANINEPNRSTSR